MRLIYVTDDQTAVSSSPLLGPETSVTTASIIRSGHLPPPQLGIISEIERAIKTLARTQAVKERICEYIQQEVSYPYLLFEYKLLHFIIKPLLHTIYSTPADIVWLLLSVKQLRYSCPRIVPFSVFYVVRPVADHQHGICSTY
jgi:hypothetical protein